jgi:putative transposase
MRIQKPHTMPDWDKVKAVTFSRGVRVWYVQVTFEEAPRAAPEMPRKPVGVDVGSTTLAITSDEQRFGNYRARNAAWEAELDRRNRALSRCKRRSKRRRKVKVKLARIGESITAATTY